MIMEQLIKDMLDKKNWVVVGAHPSPEKFGNKIYKKLKQHGYNVVPVNPVYDEVEGVNTVASLKEVTSPIDCINVVVSPKRAMVVVKDAIDMGIKRIWFQPGAFNGEVIDYAEQNGLEVVFHACVLVELDR
jgi:predicted CoA-binding protein